MDCLTPYRNVLLVERVKNPGDWSALLSEWEVLDQATYPRSPFTSPGWFELWWKHLRRNGLLFRDRFFGHVVRDADGRLVAIAPLMRTVYPGTGLPILRIVQFFGTDPSLTEFRGVICRPEDHRAVVEALAEHFQRHAHEWDVFRWNGLREPEDDYRLPPGCDGFSHRRDIPDYIMDLPDSFEQIRASVSSNMRKNLRKAYEFLERDRIRFTFTVIENPSDNQSAIDAFLALHAARSDAADMIMHPNKFTNPTTRAFLFDYLRVRTAAGEPLFFQVEIDGKVVASRLAFLLNTDLYLYFAGYDPTWRDYSIMTVLSAEVMKWAIGRGLRRLNLSTGTDQSKTRWKPTEIVLRDAVQISPTLRAKFAHQVFRVYEEWSNKRDQRYKIDASGPRS
ncbi:MAG TPA: GNAT family N-acetyltransferase [Rhodopila sp.]|uniref:GNAT family N-acetyltransferase n=1 Tax=Rhodopila sp. TaxID=2480087 RepID=UPI002CFC890B|nr:GNAT family N-acetyltransferase [Rhodopila sp.]HVY18315.1 GNAT family N-acetyltransferase [Rhodopila sp.]